MTLAPLTTETMRSTSEHCALCALAESPDEQGARHSDGDAIVAYVDDDAVVLLPRLFDGAFVAPRRHVEGIFALTGQALPNFLAALRRTAEIVKTIAGDSGPAIEPSREIPMTEGHICFRVMPVSASSPPLSSPAEVQARAIRLRRSLQAQTF
jgi:hypothetical protein